MKLKRKEKCPIHNSYFCCGRKPFEFKRKPMGSRDKEAQVDWVRIGPGTWELPDGRQYRTKSALRALVIEKVREQNGRCAICKDKFMSAAEVTADHIEPRGMGGARRDDSPTNIQAAHLACNLQKGSKRA